MKTPRERRWGETGSPRVETGSPMPPATYAGRSPERGMAQLLTAREGARRESVGRE